VASGRYPRGEKGESWGVGKKKMKETERVTVIEYWCKCGLTTMDKELFFNHVCE